MIPEGYSSWTAARRWADIDPAARLFPELLSATRYSATSPEPLPPRNVFRAQNLPRKECRLCRVRRDITRAISAEVGEIERQLRLIEKKLENIGARASTNANEAAEGLGDAVASALGGWADRFRRSANVVSDQSAAIGKDAANLGGMALRRLSQEAERRPLYTVAVAVGIGVLIGLAARGWD